MRVKKYGIAFTVIMMVLATMVGTVCGAPQTETENSWDISFLGTMQVPGQLEIVNGRDIATEFIKLGEKARTTSAVKDSLAKAKPFSREDIEKLFANNDIGVYQLALKDNGSYNTAMVFAGKIPGKHNKVGQTFFNYLNKANEQQQQEIHTLILKTTDDLYTKSPDLRDMFELEILEFYPFEQITTKNAQIVSVGASVAMRICKLIQPAALKVYVINKNSEIYLFGVVSAGPDRKLWDDMTKEMLTTMN